LIRKIIAVTLSGGYFFIYAIKYFLYAMWGEYKPLLF